METARQRIESILNYKHINAKQLSELLGCDRPQIIYDIIKEKTKSISNNISIKITSVFPEINKTWLLTGEGEMLNSEECQPSIGETITISREAWQTIVSQQETIRKQQEDLSRLIAAMLGKTDEQPKKAAASL